VAMTDVGLTEPALRGALHDYFVWSTGRLSAFPSDRELVPDGLDVPRWTPTGSA
jgi:hemoglobin